MLASKFKTQLRKLKREGRSNEMIQICHCSSQNGVQDVSLVLRLNQDDNVMMILDYRVNEKYARLIGKKLFVSK